MFKLEDNQVKSISVWDWWHNCKFSIVTKRYSKVRRYIKATIINGPEAGKYAMIEM